MQSPTAVDRACIHPYVQVLFSCARAFPGLGTDRVVRPFVAIIRVFGVPAWVRDANPWRRLSRGRSSTRGGSRTVLRRVRRAPDGAPRSHPPCPVVRCRCRTSATARRTGSPCRHSHASMAAAVASHQTGELPEPPVGESGTPRMAVVDEDRRQPVWPDRRRHPADVAAVAAGDQWQQADRRVLGGVQRAGNTKRLNAVVLQCLRSDRAHHGHRVERLGGHVEVDEVDHLTVESPSQVADHGVAHRHRHRRRSSRCRRCGVRRRPTPRCR